MGKKVVAAIRPENVVLNGKNPFAKTGIEIIEPQGSHTITGFKIWNMMGKVLITDHRQFKAGEPVSLSVDPLQGVLSVSYHEFGKYKNF